MVWSNFQGKEPSIPVASIWQETLPSNISDFQTKTTLSLATPSTVHANVLDTVISIPAWSIHREQTNQTPVEMTTKSCVERTGERLAKIGHTEDKALQLAYIVSAWKYGEPDVLGDVDGSSALLYRGTS